jgi:hypothetical protein
MMPTCMDCKHWYKPAQDKPYANFNIHLGRCCNSKMFYGKDSERIMVDTTDVTMPDLYTGACFGCCHWEPKP